jgi:hypothetical protein
MVRGAKVIPAPLLPSDFYQLFHEFINREMLFEVGG